MDVGQTRYADVTVLSPLGKLDHDNSPGFQRQLLSAVAEGQATKVVIDASRVEYVSSAGLRALMIGFKQSRGAGGRLAISGLTPLVAEIFQISRFDTVLEVHPSLDDALAALSPAARAAHVAGSSGP